MKMKWYLIRDMLVKRIIELEELLERDVAFRDAGRTRLIKGSLDLNKTIYHTLYSNKKHYRDIQKHSMSVR